MKQRRDITLGEMQDEKLYAIALEKRKNGNGTTRKDYDEMKVDIFNIDTPIEEHSKKPDCARDRITELFGDLPRIELFARQHADGWDCWGE